MENMKLNILLNIFFDVFEKVNNDTTFIFGCTTLKEIIFHYAMHVISLMHLRVHTDKVCKASLWQYRWPSPSHRVAGTLPDWGCQMDSPSGIPYTTASARLHWTLYSWSSHQAPREPACCCVSPSLHLTADKVGKEPLKYIQPLYIGSSN